MARTKVSVNNEDFLKAYLDFQSDGKSYDDLSAKLNLAPLSLYQRFQKLSKEMSAQGVELPKMHLKSSKKGKVSVDRLVEVFNKHIKNYANNVAENVAQNIVETQDINTVKQEVVGSSVAVKKKNSSEMEYVDA